MIRMYLFMGDIVNKCRIASPVKLLINSPSGDALGVKPYHKHMASNLYLTIPSDSSDEFYSRAVTNKWIHFQLNFSLYLNLFGYEMKIPNSDSNYISQ